MSLINIKLFSNFYNPEFIYSNPGPGPGNIFNRNDFINNIEFNQDNVKEGKQLFNNMNTEFFKQFIQKGFSIGDGIKYVFCLVPYSEKVSYDYYVQSLKKIFYFGYKNNIEIIYCLVKYSLGPGLDNQRSLVTRSNVWITGPEDRITGPEDRITTNDDIIESEFSSNYYELKNFLSTEVVLEKTFTLSNQNDIEKYIQFCSMFDTYILIDDDLIYWSWYLNPNWSCCKIVAPNEIKNKFPENDSIDFIEV
jgi:hypothetical protein